MAPRRPIVAVCGGNTASEPLLAEAEALGRALVDAGYRLATGGRGGVMEAASRGARLADGWEEGRIVGVLPSLDPSDANPWVDVVVPTGLHHARNAVLVAMADVVVAVGGGAGTLSEIGLAWRTGRPVVALDLGEGWSARLAGQPLDGSRDDIVHRATSAEAVLRRVNALLESP